MKKKYISPVDHQVSRPANVLGLRAIFRLVRRSGSTILIMSRSQYAELCKKNLKHMGYFTHIILILAGHPLRGWPARLRGHKGSGLWKVWTVPSPPLPCPPSPPSRVPNLIKLGPAVWPKRASVAPPWRSASGHFDQAGSSRLAEARECGAALAISE